MTLLDQHLAQTLNERRVVGKYRGFVADNADPEKRGRLKLRVPALLGDVDTDWALPCFPCGGLANQGWYGVPRIGAQVWVEFEAGHLDHPIWTGTFWQQADDVPGAILDPPTTTLLRTPKGHALRLEDKDAEETLELLHSGGASIAIDAQGSLALTDQNGGKVTLDAQNNQLLIEDANGNRVAMSASGTTVKDAHGNQIEMAAAGITVKGARIVVEGSQVLLGGSGGEPVIKGTSFLTLFATHVHTCAVGPTSPPIPQGEMSSLSSKVMAS